MAAIGCDGKAAMCRNTPRLLGSGHFASFPAGPESPHAAQRTRGMRSNKEEDKALLGRAPFSLAGHLSLWRASIFVPRGVELARVSYEIRRDERETATCREIHRTTCKETRRAIPSSSGGVSTRLPLDFEDAAHCKRGLSNRVLRGSGSLRGDSIYARKSMGCSHDAAHSHAI